MTIWLAVALLVAPGTDAAADTANGKFKECIKGATIDTFDAVSAACLKRYHDATPSNAADGEPVADPLAKRVADDEADKYTLLLTAERYDPQALCVQAGLAARAYLDAKMMTQYDRWKANERRSCGEAEWTGRVRN
jgi:hypothetical protein